MDSCSSHLGLYLASVQEALAVTVVVLLLILTPHLLLLSCFQLSHFIWKVFALIAHTPTASLFLLSIPSIRSLANFSAHIHQLVLRYLLSLSPFPVLSTSSPGRVSRAVQFCCHWKNNHEKVKIYCVQRGPQRECTVQRGDKERGICFSHLLWPHFPLLHVCWLTPCNLYSLPL